MIYLLQNKAITLLNPATWDDTNDSYSLSVYKEKRKLKSLLALCFTETAETYHHWHVFAGGNGGACIEFNRERLLAAFDEYIGVRHQKVEYRTLVKIGGGSVTVNELPFVKRAGFVDEKEFRVIWEDSVDELNAVDISIPLNAIDAIYLNPWLAPALVDATKATLKSIPGCNSLRIFRSTLVGNKRWKEAVSNAVDKRPD
ncbi:hypothetical protein CI15_00315 [Paraburkholderia monticola]|uniref:DUF2971 domain-containing protein n=1 Tax=Paraburkholderia monticola TaxID=1399968 RepID=A0A149Q1H8_9BURK|nr:hypothetical protein CI15_00315 [Paraburkholderia monticola]